MDGEVDAGGGVGGDEEGWRIAVGKNLELKVVVIGEGGGGGRGCDERVGGQFVWRASGKGMGRWGRWNWGVVLTRTA